LNVKTGARQGRSAPEESAAAPPTTSTAAEAMPPERALKAALSAYLHDEASELEEHVSNLRAAVLRIESNTTDRLVEDALSTAREAIERITQVATGLRERALFHPASLT
jgi:hypothetical protein